jgi:Pentapeptide repeats (8 copies)
MANAEHLEILGQGEFVWNEWRRRHPEVIPDLAGAELQGRQLAHYDLSKADLSGAALMGADLRRANLAGAQLDAVKINDARAPYADFSEARLPGAYLWGSDFRETIFRDADLSGANLMCAQLVSADFRNANLSGCKVYGVSAWDVKLDGANQEQLLLTPPNEPNPWVVSVGDLHVAQFIYLLLSQDTLREVLDSVSERGVLILGRFRGGGLEILNAISTKLRELNYVPIIFNFPRQKHRTITETVKTLVGLSRFVIVDLSGPSVAQELQATVPHFKIPFVPILEEGATEWSMFGDFLDYQWVLEPVRFADQEALISMLPTHVIEPAEQRVVDRQRKLRELFAKGQS